MPQQFNWVPNSQNSSSCGCTPLNSMDCDWPIVGATGEVGATGATGVVGGIGLQGSTGNIGGTGATGFGATGIQGIQGIQGNVGATGAGATGSTGINGLTGLRGSTGNIGSTGATGFTGVSPVITRRSFTLQGISVGQKTFFYDPADVGWTVGSRIRAVADSAYPFDWVEGNVVGVSNSYVTVLVDRTQGAGQYSIWDIALSGDGGKGFTGSTGLTGLQGATGLRGSTGSGATGVGATGLRGSTGATGIQGIQGATGSGSTGFTGSTGATGIAGFTGSTGATGIQGFIGSTGATGVAGFIGSTGSTGIQGFIGSTGATGVGATGFNGSTGATGITPVVPIELGFACSDETSSLTVGTSKITFRMPCNMTLTSVRSAVNTAPTGSSLIVDINESGVSVLSTKLSIDAGQKTSTTSSSPVVISDSALVNDAEITIDLDQVGSTIAGTGLKVWLIGNRA